MSGCLGFAIATLVAATPMCPEIFIEIFRHCMMRLSLTRSGGSSRRPVGVLPANFSIFGRKKSHQFLIMSKNLLQNLCSSCCDCWCRIFRLGAVHHVLLVLEFREKADHGFFNNICLPVSSFLDGQLSSPYDFLMGFARRVLERYPCFLGQR